MNCLSWQILIYLAVKTCYETAVPFSVHQHGFYTEGHLKTYKNNKLIQTLSYVKVSYAEFEQDNGELSPRRRMQQCVLVIANWRSIESTFRHSNFTHQYSSRVSECIYPRERLKGIQYNLINCIKVKWTQNDKKLNNVKLGIFLTSLNKVTILLHTDPQYPRTADIDLTVRYNIYLATLYEGWLRFNLQLHYCRSWSWFHYVTRCLWTGMSCEYTLKISK